MEPVSRTLDLSPARWVWYPSGRTLQNTFILFRRELMLTAKPRRATGWIAADSRYRLELNGRRIQWGPAPSDPRWSEADPLDLTTMLREGKNVLGAIVLFYGRGDGTWPLGKPGFIFRLEIEHADGRMELVTSDTSWNALLCRAWQPGHYTQILERRAEPFCEQPPLADGRETAADLESLNLVARTVRGDISFACVGKPGARTLKLTLPKGCDGELVLSTGRSPLSAGTTTTTFP